MKMKFAVGAASAAVLLITGLTIQAQPQNSQNPPKYRVVTLDYHKPEPGKTSDYIRLERIWKAIHQERVNKGKITSWKLYAVEFPNADKQEYDFVTMTEFANFADLEAPYAGIDYAAILGDSKYQEMRGMTNSVQKLTRRDTLSLLLSTSNWAEADNKVLNVAFLKTLPGKNPDFMKVQRDYYLPIGEDQIKSGRVSSWATSVVRFPEALDNPYSHVSFNAYGSLSEMEKQMPKEFADKWRPKYAEASVMLNASRTRVKGELWRLVERTNPK